MSEISSSQLWPYSERNGVGVGGDVEILLTEPEIQLDREELAEARIFAAELFYGRTALGIECDTAKTLEQINEFSTSANTQIFYVEYFRTEEGKGDFLKFGFGSDSLSNDRIASLLLDVPYVSTHLEANDRKTIAASSQLWREKQMAEYLKNDSAQDVDQEDFYSITVNYQPEKLLEKLEDLQAYRRFYRQVRSSIKQEPESNLSVAKKTLLDVHIARVNNLMADLYASAVDLARQIDMSEPNEAVDSWNRRLSAAVPILTKARNDDTFEQYTDGLAKRLDFVRNGVSQDENGRITPISNALLSLETSESPAVLDELRQNIKVSEKQLEIIDAAKWTGEELKEFNEAILAKWDLLSEHRSTWQEVAERNGPAPDGKWQYIIDKESRKSLGVNGTKKVVFGPPKFGRSLSAESPAGALPVSAHELTHVLQNEYDEILAEQIPLAKIKGARYLAVREMGGIMQERKIQANFGRSRSTNLHYLRALEVKLQGGNRVQVARAFYNSYISGKQLSDEGQKSARELAMNRALRLFRNNGHESQPLEYAEQDLIAQALDSLSPAERSAIAIAGGSFSLRHSAALHRVGLLKVPKEISDNPAEDVWKHFVENHLSKIA